MIRNASGERLSRSVEQLDRSRPQDQEAASGGGLVDQDAQGAEELREVLHLVDDHESA